jgi:hypothetical protein
MLNIYGKMNSLNKEEKNKVEKNPRTYYTTMICISCITYKMEKLKTT